MPKLSSLLNSFLVNLSDSHGELLAACEIALKEQVIVIKCPNVEIYQALSSAWPVLSVDFYETKKRLGAVAASRLELVCDGKKTRVTNGLPQSLLLRAVPKF